MKLIVPLFTFVLLSSAYKFTVPPFAANWHLAHELCSSFGQRLVTVETREKYDKLQTFLKSSDKFTAVCMFWIAASDLAEENTFSWLHTGRLVTFAKWSPKEPFKSKDRERCVRMKHDTATLNTTDFLWGVMPCTNSYYFVCETVEDVISFNG
ncbi:C-type lectin 37Da-like [Uranotaenia lowii]|uniref:C-type lectin 37Da-like n=1 Tax=Uranotaenia lowii TaxID=190385 RepID=UPI0024785F85|nr:C-type lectin 37Da-like [Uranotaenia lowii]